ncbi:MAG: pyridoxal phosphate-dependent aminotransferase [Acidobacteria bacterium]|uniref:Aminotransferase n=1 Tax=Candidatus Polarisedimenticola svalbardensis TaxID=2886004 RepID=A0A8J6XWU5_9BACT|nr:pyridoxal phosphate-dependent aminotransferase [Candidatus Polarisedimenticola svalbardensis]
MPTTRKLSQRASDLPASPIRRLAPYAVAARAAGKKVYSLNIGQPDIRTPGEILDRLKTYEDVNIPYGPSQGTPEFLETLQSYYRSCGLEVGIEDLFVTTGGSEAILFVLGIIADPGDEILVFEPYYTNYSGFAAMLGVVPVPVTTPADQGYHLPDRSEIESKIGNRTRAIMLCSPNNPTGTVYTDQELELLADLCKKHDLYLVADEVYREFTYDGLKHRSALTLPGMEDRTIVVDSLSKRISVCGLRIGNIVCRNKELMAAILKAGQARLCPPTLGQHLGAGLMDVPASYMTEVIAEYEGRRDLVFDALSAIPGVGLRKPEGAFYVCAGFPVDDADRFAQYMLEEFDHGGETVMMAPAEGFYATPGLGRDEARIAYVLNRDDLTGAMKALAEGLKVYPGRT